MSNGPAVSGYVQDALVYLSGAIAAVLAAYAARRKISGDKLAVSENDSKSAWISEQGRMLIEMQRAHQECMSESAMLRGQVNLLTQQLDDVRAELERVKRILRTARPDLNEIFPSAPMPFDK